MRRTAPLALLFACLALSSGCGKKPAPTPDPGPNVKIEDAPDPAAERTKQLAKLKSSDQKTRSAAVEDISWLAEDDPAVLPALVEMLRDKGAAVKTGFIRADRINSTREAAALTILQCTGGEKVMREKGLPVLKEGLTDQSAVIREHTAYTIGQLGTIGKPLATDVQKLCTDPDENVRGVAFDTLRVIGVGDPVALAKLLKHDNEEIVRLAAELIALVPDMPEGGVAPLSEALKSENTNIQTAAATGLAAAGPRAASAAPLLAEAIKKYYPAEYDPFAARAEGVEYAYWRAMEKIGEPAVAQLLKLLDHTNREVQARALDTLAAIGPPAKSAAEVLKKMMAKRDGASLYAAYALVRIGESKDEALALLKEGLKTPSAAGETIQLVIRLGDAGKSLHEPALANLSSSETDARVSALALVGTLPAAEASKLAPEMSKLATDESSRVRTQLGRVLEKLGPTGAPAADALGKALKDERDSLVRDQFVEALLAMGPGAKPAVPGLLPLVSDRDVTDWMRVKIIAAVALADPAAPEVSAALVKAAGDNDMAIRVAAAGAIGKLNPLSPDALNTLVNMAKKDGNNDPRVAALRAMAAAGPRAKAARSDLEAISTGPQPGLAMWAKVALASVDGDVNKAAADIRAGLGARNALVRSSAVEALLMIGPTKDDLPALMKVMRDTTSSTKIAAATAISRLGPSAKDAVPPLTKLLDDNETEVRIAAAEALGSIGPAAFPAVRKLKELLQTPTARAAAQRALDKIGAK